MSVVGNGAFRRLGQYSRATIWVFDDSRCSLSANDWLNWCKPAAGARLHSLSLLDECRLARHHSALDARFTDEKPRGNKLRIDLAGVRGWIRATAMEIGKSGQGIEQQGTCQID